MAVNLKPGRFVNVDLAVIISSVRKLTVLYCLAYTADDDS